MLTKYILMKTQVAIRQVGGINKVDQMLEENPEFWFAVDSEGLALVTRDPRKLENIIFATQSKIESYQALHKLIEAFIDQIPPRELLKYKTLVGNG